MKSITYILVILAVSLFTFTACDRENMDFGNETDAYGQIQLSSMKLSVDVNATPLSRAVSVDASNYIVGIYSKDGSTLISEWKYSEMPEIFQLKVGEYQVIAHSPNADAAAFDEPYCEGSVSFAITKDQVTNLETVKCTLHSIVVTIKYEDAFKELLGEEVNIVVKVNKQDNESLNFTKDETRSGYFRGMETDNVVDVSFLGTIDGEDEVPINKSYSGIAIGSQLIITYVLKDANGDPGSGGEANVALRVDTRCEVKNLDGSVLPNKEPGIEDFPSDGDKEPEKEVPTITGDGFNIANALTVDENLETLNVKLAAPAGLSHVFISIESDNPEFQEAVNLMFELNEENSIFDLAEPKEGTQKDNLNLLKFPIEDAIKEKRTVDFDISGFLSALRGFPGNHKFKIQVVDANEETASATLTLVVPRS